MPKPHSVARRGARPPRHRLGPGGQKAAIQAAKLGKRVAVAERRERLGGVSIHTGHDPLQDAARGGARRSSPSARSTCSTRPASRRRERAALAAADGPRGARGRRRDRGRARAVPPQPRRPAARRRRASRTTTRSAIDGRRRADPRRADRDRRRHAPGAAGRRSSSTTARSSTPTACCKLEQPRAAHDDGRRRRRDRRRVRVDVRRARHEGDGRRPARRACCTFLDGEIGEAFQYLLRRAQRDVPAAREASTRSSGASGRGARRAAGVGQGDRRPRPCSTRPAARAPPTALGLENAGLEADKRGRIEVDERLPHGGAAHLRRRRRAPAARPRRDGDGAGPDRRAARVRPAGRRRCPSWSRPASTRSPRSRMVGRTEEELTDAARALRGRHRALDASSRAG